MLTLTRKVGESIRVGPEIVVTVKEIRRNQVRIGIQAPRSISVYRDEIAEEAGPGILDPSTEDPDLASAISALKRKAGLVDTSLGADISESEAAAILRALGH